MDYMAKGTVNKATVLGHLGDAPQIRYTSGSGIPVASVSVATTERFKKNGAYEERTEWHKLILWDGLAKVAEKYLKKGSKIYAEGRMQTRSYVDHESGLTKYVHEIVVQDLEMLGDPRSAEHKEQESYAAAYAGGAPVVTNQDSEPDLSEMPNF
jgi:single-strand DNA-binding protein